MLATLAYSAPLIWPPVRPTAGSEIASVGPSFEPSRSHLRQRWRSCPMVIDWEYDGKGFENTSMSLHFAPWDRLDSTVIAAQSWTEATVD